MSKQILSGQSKFNRFLETYPITCYDVPPFSTKNEYVIILKMTNF